MKIKIIGERTKGNDLKTALIDTESKIALIGGTYSVVPEGDVSIQAKNNKAVIETLKRLEVLGFDISAYDNGL